MRRVGVVTALAIALLSGASLAHAQRTTERFIPLGRSPGVSGKLSAIGNIVAVDREARRIVLESPAGRVSVAVPDPTPIWIDRHEQGLGAAIGSFADCQTGRLAEVKFADPETQQRAEWVKLRDATGARSP